MDTLTLRGIPMSEFLDSLVDSLNHLLNSYGDLRNWRLLLGLAVSIALCLGILFGLDNEAIRWSLGLTVLILGATLSHLWQRSCDPQD